jgi:hypothetical protein
VKARGVIAFEGGHVFGRGAGMHFEQVELEVRVLLAKTKMWRSGLRRIIPFLQV